MTETISLQQPAQVDMDDARMRRVGWWFLLVGFGGFLLWALLAPLDAGVSAPGTVMVSGYRKVVDSLVPGRIAAIEARDGDQVEEGQVVLRLDDAQSRSDYDIAKGQWLVALATEARLSAERSGGAAPVYPPELEAEAADPRAIAAMTVQSQLFATRRAALNSELAAMSENLRGLELQAAGLEASRQSKEDSLKSMRKQLADLQPLAAEGFIARNRVLETERTATALVGAIGEDTGSLGRYSQSIAEIKARMRARREEGRTEVETQLSDTQRDLAALTSRLEGLRFALDNTVIKAPVAGVVMGLSVHTVGGVVSPGNPLMYVVPQDGTLQIEAQIAPHLIDKVRAGVPVDILFSAFSQATTPRIPGEVLSVSADVLVEPKQGLPYYKATVQVTREGMALLRSYEIRPGMPAEVFFRTGERTAMNYLMKPLLDRLQRGMTEP